MAHGLVARFFLSLAFFWAGLHCVGFGIKSSGTAGPGNPVWPMIQALYSAEAAVLHAVYRTLQAVCLILLLLALGRGLSALWAFLQAREVTPVPPAARPSRHLPSASANAVIQLQLLPQSPHPEPSATVTSAPVKIEAPKPPTAEELKAKAIRQIVGR